MNFEDKLIKYARSGSILRSAGAFFKKPERAAAAVVGTATIGAGFIDTRKKIDTSKAPKLNPYWNEVKRIAQPGDVLIGANRPPSVREYLKGYKIHYKENLKRGMSKDEARKKAIKDIKLTSVPAKMYDKVHSHLEMIGVKDKSFYSGGGKPVKITESTLPKDRAAYEKFRERGLDPYFLLLRKKNPKENIFYNVYKQKGAEAADELSKRIALKKENYNVPLSIYEAGKRTILPKLRYKGPEKLRSRTQILAANKNYTGGVCSTTAGMLSTKTISGHDVKTVMPQDPLYSKDYEVVAQIGKDRNVPIFDKAVFNSWKATAKAGAGAATAGVTYGVVRGARALIKNPGVRKTISKVV